MISTLVFAAVLSAGPADAYEIEKIALPEGAVMEIGAIRYLPANHGRSARLAVATRRGEVWMLENPDGDISKPKWTRYAHGLHEVLGLAWKPGNANEDGRLYVTQRPDVSKLQDVDGDGRADTFDVYADGWGISGDYHEYAFGTDFLPEGTPYAGEIWLGLCLTGSFSSKVPYRGWALRVKPPADGAAVADTIPVTSGVRSPGGIAFNSVGDVFYTDNQGPWNGACALKHLPPGKFVGHPGGFEWYKLAEEHLGPKPEEPSSESRMMTEADKIPELEPPAVLFPYDKMGKSSAGIVFDNTDGKFGPWTNADGTGQSYVCDQSGSTVMRVCLEKVDGHYQGACLPMLAGFSSGNLAMEQLPSGTLFVGGTNRGWGSVGKDPFSLERVKFTGKKPVSLERISAKPDGFELTFTQPVGESATDVASYGVESWRYIYQASYGSPEVDAWTPEVASVERTGENSVRIRLNRIERDFVYQVSADGVTTTDGSAIDQPTAYYTLNYVPSE